LATRVLAIVKTRDTHKRTAWLPISSTLTAVGHLEKEPLYELIQSYQQTPATDSVRLVSKIMKFGFLIQN